MASPSPLSAHHEKRPKRRSGESSRMLCCCFHLFDRTNSWQRARHVPTRRAVFEIKRCQAAAHASPNTRDGHDRQPHAHPFSTPSSSSSDVLLSVYISTTGLIPLRAGPMNFSLKCVARKWLEIFHLSENVWGNPPPCCFLLTHYVVDGFWVAIEMQLFIPTTMTNPIYFFNIKVMLWVKGRKLNHFWQGMSDASREVLRRHSNPRPRELYYYILCVMELVWNGNA